MPHARSRPTLTPLEGRDAPAAHVWTGNGATGNWSDAGNWAGGVPIPGEPGGTVVVFNTADPSSTQDIPGLVLDQLRFDPGADVRLTLGQNLGIDGALFLTHVVDATGRNTITGAADLVLSGASVAFVTTATSGTLTVAADITGPQGLRKLGAGTLALTGSGGNTYAGATNVAEGTLRLDTRTDDAGLSVNVVVGDGSDATGFAVLELAGASEVPNGATVRVRGDGAVTLLPSAVEDVLGLTLEGAAGGGRVNILARAELRVAANGTVAATAGASPAAIFGPGKLTISPGVTFNVADAAVPTELFVDAPVAGPADLVKTGAGAMALGGANTYTGLTRINGGVLLAGTGVDKVAFTRIGTVLVAEGTAGADTFAFAPRSGFYDVVADGVPLRFDATAANVVVFRGNGGTDRADLFAAGSGNLAGLTPTYGVLKGGSGYEVYVGNGMEAVTVTGQPGDVGYLAGSETADALGATPAFATLSGTGFSNTLAGFGTVGAFGNGGVDTAYLVGSGGADNFVATPTYAGMVGGGSANYAAGFEGVIATGGGGADAAYLADSEQADTIVADGASATLTLPAVTVVVDGFVGVVAYGFGGGVNRKQVGAVGFFLELPGVWVG